MILDCPFCGSQAEMVRDSGNEVWPQSFRVACTKCEAKSPAYYGSSTWRVNQSEDKAARKKALEWWNRREYQGSQKTHS